MHLYALILHLRPTQRATLPAMLGAEVHAAFLALIRTSNPRLSAWLHDDHGQVKPFGVSLLAPWKVLNQKAWELHPGHLLRLRVTLVGQPLYQEFMQHFLTGQYRIVLKDVEFQTDRIVASGAGEEMAGHATTAQLWASATPEPYQRLRFVMPTTWKQGAKGQDPHYALWPEPRALFQKLSQTWHAWSEPSLHFPYRTLLDELRQDAVIPVAHHLRTVHWEARNPPTQGFIGWIRFRVGGSPEFQRWIDLLSRFAFFSGVGNASGRGLGVVTRE